MLNGLIPCITVPMPSDARNGHASISRLRSIHDDGDGAEIGEALGHASRLQHTRYSAADAVVEDTLFNVDGFHHPVFNHHRIAL